MVKSKATEDKTVHPLAAQVGNLKFPESGKMNIVKEKMFTTCSLPGADLAQASRRMSGAGAGLRPVAKHTWRNW